VRPFVPVAAGFVVGIVAITLGLSVGRVATPVFLVLGLACLLTAAIIEVRRAW
jgi:hypothetical protein